MFGLIFDGVILTYGLSRGYSAVSFVIVTVLNLLIGFTFLGLTTVWLSPSSGRRVPSKDFVLDIEGAKKAYSRVGFALAAMFFCIYAGQYVFPTLMPGNQLLALYLPIYAIGFPVCLLIMGKKDVAREQQNRLDLRHFLVLIPVCFFVMYAGNIIGYLLQGVFNFFFPFSLGLRVAVASTGNYVLQALILAIVAPVMEEFVFRRLVIDRLYPYGEKAALLTSALLFALFHGTVNQFCYAFLLGLVFGYVYLKTWRIRYSIILHITINTLSSIVLPLMLSLAARPLIALNEADLSVLIAEPEIIAILAYISILLIVSLFGAVVFCYGIREHDLSADSIKMKTVFSSAGVLVFTVMSGVMLLCG